MTKRYVFFFFVATMSIEAFAQDPMVEYQRQVDKFWEQAEEADRHLKATQEQLVLSEKIMLEQMDQLERNVELLERWEKIVDRYEKLLDREEARMGTGS